VLVERQRVHHQGVAEQVHLLAGMADAVCPVEVQRVLEAPVDRLRIRPPNWNWWGVPELRIDRGGSSTPLPDAPPVVRSMRAEWGSAIAEKSIQCPVPVLKGARARLLAEGSQRHTEQWSGCRLSWSSWPG
jgi:hypothetical protein